MLNRKNDCKAFFPCGGVVSLAGAEPLAKVRDDSEIVVVGLSKEGAGAAVTRVHVNNKIFGETWEVQKWCRREEFFHWFERLSSRIAPVFLQRLSFCDFFAREQYHGFDYCCEVRDKLAYKIYHAKN